MAEIAKSTTTPTHMTTGHVATAKQLRIM